MTQAECNVSQYATENISRRKFAAGVGFVALSPALGYPAIRKASEARRLAELDREFSGFDELTIDEYNILFKEYSEKIINKGVLVNNGESQQIDFDLSEDRQVIVTFQPSTHDFPFAQPLIITSDQHNYNRRYLAPVIHSPHPGRKLYSKIQLGNHSEGAHSLKVSQDESSSFTSDSPIHYAISTYNDQSLLAQFLKNSPIVQIKNPENAMDDMPVASFCKILKKDNRYQVITTLVMSSQNGGLEPSENLSSYGKIYDVEWVIQQLYDEEGNLIHNRQRFQRRSHGVQAYDPEVYGDQPYLYTATPNNNFSDGKIRIFGFEFDDPRLNSEEDSIVFSSVPLVLPGSNALKSIDSRYPDLTAISLNEIFREGCLEFVEEEGFADFNGSYFADQILAAQEFMLGEYKNRNCKDPIHIFSSNVRNP